MKSLAATTSTETLFFPLVTYLAVINALLPEVIRTLLSEPFNAAVFNGLGHSFVVWVVLFISMRLTLEVQFSKVKTTPVYIYAGILLCSLLLIPSALLSWLVAAASAWLWLRHPMQEKHRIAATILFAMAIREPCCQLSLTLFANQILTFDAWFSSLFLPLFQIEAAVAGNTIVQANGFSLLVLTGCSAFTNMSLALLLWLTLSLLKHGDLERRDIKHAVILALVVLTINGLRLSAMTINHAWYSFLHDGFGATAIEIFTFIVTLICVRRRDNYENGHSTSTGAHFIHQLVTRFKNIKNH
ncbi:hypothetical protein [Neptuniibacter sp. QD34_54]|uniref:hypothetical protein n=1 Tax=Neptuniibacter sp. QD34_54 TaxID=3398208 RepID=UPI0039F62071